MQEELINKLVKAVTYSIPKDCDPEFENGARDAAKQISNKISKIIDELHTRVTEQEKKDE